MFSYWKLLLTLFFNSWWVLSRTKAPPGSIVAFPRVGGLKLAVDALKGKTGPQLIFLTPGTYNENVFISYAGPLTIEGATSDEREYGVNQAKVVSKLSSPQAGTLQKSAALWIMVESFVMLNVDVSNNFGPGTQAVAVATQGSKQAFRGCSFRGFQDTLYVMSGTQYFYRCNIDGNVDFIFGSGRSVFDRCNIGVLPNSQGKSIIAASRRPNPNDPGMFVFSSSRITGSKAPPGSVYLGRPWERNGKIHYQLCDLSEVIAPEGWTFYRNQTAGKEGAQFYEFQNTGKGSNTAGRQFLADKKNLVNIKQLLGGDSTSLFSGQKKSQRRGINSARHKR